MQTTIPIEEIRQFILNQPDEKMVDLMEGTPNETYGCILTHYCQEKKIDFDYCGFCYISLVSGELIMISKNILNLFETHRNAGFRGTYRELKKLLK